MVNPRVIEKNQQTLTENNPYEEKRLAKMENKLHIIPTNVTYTNILLHKYIFHILR